MALKDFFRRPSALARFRLPPLGPEMDGYCNWLCGQGYSRNAVRRHIWKVSQFNQYLRRRGVKDCHKLEMSLADRFIRNHLVRCQRGNCSRSDHAVTAGAIRSLMAHMSNQGLIPVATVSPPPYHSLLEEYLDHLNRERNLAQETIEKNRRHLIAFLEDLGPDAVPERLCRLSPQRVQGYFVKHSKDAKSPTLRHIQRTLRTFFRFCVKRGYLKRDLAQAVPRLRKYKLSHIPRGLADEDVAKILDSIDRTTPVGRRDFAIIQLLATYGVRGGQVCALRLQDVRWRQSRIHFPALKGGKEVVEPLTDQAGASLLEYLRRGRPEADYPEVFLTAHAPVRPLIKPSTVSQMVARHMRRAGVKSPIMGPHAFRHAFATRMLKRGQSLKTVADMLGHRHINTTFIYTKVDLETLKQLPLDWPEV